MKNKKKHNQGTISYAIVRFSLFFFVPLHLDFAKRFSRVH